MQYQLEHTEKQSMHPEMETDTWHARDNQRALAVTITEIMQPNMTNDVHCSCHQSHCAVVRLRIYAREFPSEN